MRTTTIVQEIELPATPRQVYEAYIDEAKHAAFTCYPTEIDRVVGGLMRAGGDYIQGEIVELVPDQRIVQTWRAADFPEGHYTTLEIDLEGTEAGTLLRMTHKGVPADMREEIDEGWRRHYWDPLRTYLGKH
jgi:uncharacterized protein YndB with AHSA1/START domain